MTRPRAWILVVALGGAACVRGPSTQSEDIVYVSYDRVRRLHDSEGRAFRGDAVVARLANEGVERGDRLRLTLVGDAVTAYERLPAAPPPPALDAAIASDLELARRAGVALEPSVIEAMYREAAATAPVVLPLGEPTADMSAEDKSGREPYRVVAPDGTARRVWRLPSSPTEVTEVHCRSVVYRGGPLTVSESGTTRTEIWAVGDAFTAAPVPAWRRLTWDEQRHRWALHSAMEIDEARRRCVRKLMTMVAGSAASPESQEATRGRALLEDVAAGRRKGVPADLRRAAIAVVRRKVSLLALSRRLSDYAPLALGDRARLQSWLRDESFGRDHPATHAVLAHLVPAALRLGLPVDGSSDRITGLARTTQWGPWPHVVIGDRQVCLEPIAGKRPEQLRKWLTSADTGFSDALPALGLEAERIVAAAAERGLPYRLDDAAPAPRLVIGDVAIPVERGWRLQPPSPVATLSIERDGTPRLVIENLRPVPLLLGTRCRGCFRVIVDGAPAPARAKVDFGELASSSTGNLAIEPGSRATAPIVLDPAPTEPYRLLVEFDGAESDGGFHGVLRSEPVSVPAP